MLAAMIGLWRRPGGVQLKQFFQSPADWLVVGYLGWIVWVTGSWFDTAKALIPFAAFYFVTALVLNTKERLHTFLTCWVVGLTVAMIFAVSTNYGFELAPGSADLTEQFLGRLALNTWIFNNPNSLGHGIVALIPAAYIWLVWNRPFPVRLVGLAAIVGAAQVVYLTESKGAYLCGAAAVTASLIFRRGKIVQIFTLVVMLTAGVGALQLLPRMETLDRKEGGIAGRLLIWQQAYNAMRNTRTGEGWKKFEAWIETEDYGLIRKATHGSYVNVGADLGYIGLMLFVGILYANARTVFQARPDPEDEVTNRCQRLLLSLTVSFTASAWMIDRAYHTDYFILAGAIAAFHRLVTLQAAKVEEAETETEAQTAEAGVSEAPALTISPAPVMAYAQTSGFAGLQPALAFGGHAPARLELGQETGPAEAAHEPPAEGSEPPWIGFLKWRKLELADLVMITLIFGAVLYLWERLMTSFISF